MTNTNEVFCMTMTAGLPGITSAIRIRVTARLVRACWVTVRKLAIALAITTAVLAASSGCSLIGDALQQKTTTKQNLENQKYVAFRFIKFQPDVEVITFTQEGSIDGSGEWAVNAVVTIGG